ncbi:MAG: DUF5818 domain-containing protein [Gemmatimonadales bacterium]
MRVAVGRLEGVDSARVSLDSGFVDLVLTPGNRVTVATVREAIRHQGFTPELATVRVRGRLVREEGRWYLVVPGGATFRLEGPERGPPGAVGQWVIVAGTVPANLGTGVPVLRIRELLPSDDGRR